MKRAARGHPATRTRLAFGAAVALTALATACGSSRAAPYFHDGSVATLEEAVTLMAGGGLANPHLSTDKLKPAGLSPAQIADLIEFLKSLDEPCNLPSPPLPPGA